MTKISSEGIGTVPICCIGSEVITSRGRLASQSIRGQILESRTTPVTVTFEGRGGLVSRVGPKAYLEEVLLRRISSGPITASTQQAFALLSDGEASSTKPIKGISPFIGLCTSPNASYAT